MKFLFNLVKKIFLSLLSTALTLFILYWDVMTVINALKNPDADWHQVSIYLICSAVILIIIWFMAFLRFLRNLAFLVIILLIAGWLYLPNILPHAAFDVCVVMGSCKDGTEVKTLSGKIIINEKSCIQNGWKWNNEKNTCETR